MLDTEGCGKTRKRKGVTELKKQQKEKQNGYLNS